MRRDIDCPDFPQSISFRINFKTSGKGANSGVAAVRRVETVYAFTQKHLVGCVVGYVFGCVGFGCGQTARAVFGWLRLATGNARAGVGLGG